MLKDLTQILLYAKAAVDVVVEKIESKACDLAIQVKAFSDKNIETSKNGSTPHCTLKEKAKEELMELVSEITHRAQINKVQMKGFIKEKLTEITNDALLDSMELNDIRAEIASLRAELADLKSQLTLTKAN